MEDRYSDIIKLIGKENHEVIRKSKVLIVGSGGIGCELLKTLVLVGFENLEVIDLDTIDVSNLNRQFLFRKEDVGKSKSEIATKKVLEFNPNCTIKSYHGNIFDDEFGIDYFKSFNLVINGLDNIAARKQVNRMCLLSNVPMIDGGTQGYDGQVTTTRKGETECYDCRPKNTPKSYAVCTIRQNPSALIHCIVWAKQLYERLFGLNEEDNEYLKDIDQEFSSSNIDGWCRKIYLKINKEEIEKLIEMKDVSVWKQAVPVPLDLENIATLESSQVDNNVLDEQRVWDITENSRRFLNSCKSLKERNLKENKRIPFDKDDDLTMEFVTTVANLRAKIFHIQGKSLFDIKAMAGNIIPAIATSNAIISGLEVFEAIKILTQNKTQERSSYLRRLPAKFGRQKKSCLILPLTTCSPNPNCYVCSSNEMMVKLNCEKFSLNNFVKKVLCKELGMKEPEVCFSGSIIYTDDEEEVDLDHIEKKLSKFGIKNDSLISTEDFFFEEFHWKITIRHDEELEENMFVVLSRQSGSKSKEEDKMNEDDDDDDDDLMIVEGNNEDDDDDVVMIIEQNDNDVVVVANEINQEENTGETIKRKRDDQIIENTKKRKFF